MNARCHAPNCTEAKLCDAHIIPQGFARTLSSPDGHNLAIGVAGAKRAKQPHGAFDPAILCAGCDEKLGRFDEYAIRFCASLPLTSAVPPGGIFRHKTFDGAQFARAVLSILWRASISRRDQFAAIGLGPYQDRAAAILFQNAPLSSFPELAVVLCRYALPAHDARKFIAMPLRIRSGHVNAFTVSIGGFLVWAKVDRRDIEPALAPHVINAAHNLTAPVIKFEESAEYEYFRQAAWQDRKRREARL